MINVYGNVNYTKLWTYLNNVLFYLLLWLAYSVHFMRDTRLLFVVCRFFQNILRQIFGENGFIVCEHCEYFISMSFVMIRSLFRVSILIWISAHQKQYAHHHFLSPHYHRCGALGLPLVRFSSIHCFIISFHLLITFNHFQNIV